MLLVDKDGAKFDGLRGMYSVDEAMCQHFGVEHNPCEWYAGWYDAVSYWIEVKGYNFAWLHAYFSGQEIEGLRTLKPCQEMIEVVNWLASTYTIGG